ncbi:unnamed protein product [Cylicocyclus nassatus]|uniref:EndoU domain-containing protein n=1 Tax=Cylicocyclus nassatus TaxID=53992 RepID=A0AA36M349_CYLNA|nr:unnamed protein product [Cylicocyclus nassatus]
MEANKIQLAEVVLSDGRCISRFSERVDPKLFERPTFKAFLDMTDNFNPNPKVREPQVSLKEQQREIDAFLTAALNSKPWQIFYKFLNMKGLQHAENRNVFRKWIEQIWFEHYSRSRGEVLDSSGFEHVFMGEFRTAKKKKRKVNGLHNWIRFYQFEQDASENFHYKEYKDHRKNILAALRYSWRGAEKPLGSMFIGTSPEYDMAIFTLCFLAWLDKRNCDMLITTAYWMFTCITHEGSVPSCFARDRMDKGSTLQTTLVQDLVSWNSSTQKKPTTTLIEGEYDYDKTPDSIGGAKAKSTTGKNFEKSTTGDEKSTTVKDLEESTTEFDEPPPEPEPDIEDEDIKHISRRLRKADSAILEDYGYVGLNFQNRSANAYNAPKKFIGTVSPKLLERLTFATFLNLTENFTKSGVGKRLSSREMQRKIDAFLNAVFESNLWKILYDFLKESGVKQAKDVTMFRNYVKQIWFDQYPHSTASGNTSGFEQVFVGEIRRKDKQGKQGGVVNGVQNWVRFHQLEKGDKDFDYKGYKDLRQNILATLDFTWLKAEGETSMFIGTSPEYDLAVYTLCFIARLENRCQIEMDGCSPEIIVYGTDEDGKTYVGHLALSLGGVTSTCTRKY